ncbi:MAG: Protein-glutamate methylesterase/protein-glutamine glutaminase [Syntrophus sp. SKADARSKE-3]|nr:Protein-glutamate methylesterase/protein-glutamine glutaminase [Syntrophus sp. SKADARSKE-3]
MTRKKKDIQKPKIQDLPSEPVQPPPHSVAADLAESGLLPEVPQQNFPIVGIGASAGGLAAFEAFFSGMPADTDPGMAFVLVQHLAPHYKSILSDLIRRYTRMQVYEVEDGMEVRPNCTYIIPPNRDMAFINGSLQLLEPTAPHGMRLPIDFFFRSLAQDQNERAICIILSGTGNDGTLGARAVKGEGGLVIAQTPESAEFEGMPQSVIATGMVDFVLPPAEMPAQLIAYATRVFGDSIRRLSAPEPKDENALKKILILLRAQSGHDFSQYKPNTIIRRVERRLVINRITQLDDYVRYLQQNPMELETLFRDLLIGVTNFFRDPEAFKALEEKVIPHLVTIKPEGSAIRVWSLGCSTGEEAYSIAILLRERIEALKQTFMVQVFATDIDRRSIDIARAGVYPATISADVLPDRLERFFTYSPDDDTYRIQKSIRDMIVFSEHDVVRDPPFSKLDLIICRNLLIYMGGELQKKLIPMFHYALNPGGVLFLGNSETVGDYLDLFTILDRKWKLYQRKETISSVPFMVSGKYLQSMLSGPVKEGRRNVKKGSLRELTEQALLRAYTPASMVVNERGDILFIHGHTAAYLEPAPGDTAMSISKMVREGLRRELTVAVHKAAVNLETVRYPALQFKTNGQTVTINLTVRPLEAGPDAPGRLFLVSFEDIPAEYAPPPTQTELTAAGPAAPPMDSDVRAATLEQALRAKEEYLQTTLEEMETSNEELKSSNEELETSKEELQSVNEELATVNTELQQRVSDLSQANSDMNNLMAGTGVGTVFVDRKLNIRRFTPTATQVINLIPTDIGRPVGHIVSNLVGYNRLSEDAQDVLETLIPKEMEVQTKTGDWYLLRIRPYRTLANVIDGVVLTFFEITEMKRLRELARDSEAIRRLAAVVYDASDAVVLLNLEGRILAWNPGAERMYGWSEAEAITKNLIDLIPEGQEEDSVAALNRLAQARMLEPHHTRRVAKDGRIIEVLLTATPLINETGKVYAISTTEREIAKD